MPQHGDECVIRFPVPWAILLTAICLPIVIVLREAIGYDPRTLQEYLYISLFVAVPIVLAIRYWYSNRFDETGVGGVTLLGVRTFIKWSDISSTDAVRPLILFGFPHFRLNVRENRAAILILKAMTKRPDFQQALEKFAPPGNPARALLD